MQPIDSSSNDSAFNYAFALAMKLSLVKFETDLRRQTNNGNEDTNDAIKTQDSIYYIQHILQFIIKKVLIHYREEDIKANRTNGSFAGSLSYNFEDLLLGPKANTYDIPNKLKTKELIEGVDYDSNKDKVPFWLVAERESELSEKFGVLLENTLKLQKQVLWNGDSSALDFQILSLYVGEYLRGIIANLSVVLQLTEGSVMKIDAVIDELKNIRKIEPISALPLQDFYKGFKTMVISYLDMTHSDAINQEANINQVHKLREQGNNLMSNLSYAQAIQAYTNALSLSTLASASNIPQLFTNRAIAYIGLNCFPEAITDLNEAVNYDRTFTTAWVQLGYCHLYMGTSLVALKCYLISLRTAIGEILPVNFAVEENKSLVEEYQENKMSSILPQFVERLVQAIVLTEKRAYQQREPSFEIKAVVSNVRAILAKLRSTASNEDMSYFTYTSNADDSSFRPTAERLNRTRPSILNQDVAQNMIANSGIEASAITLPATPITSFERVGRNLDTGGANARPPTSGLRNPPSGMRGLLNDFGEIFEGSGLISIDIPSENNPTQGTRNDSRAGQAGESTDANTSSVPRDISGQAPGNRNIVRDVLRGIMPDGMAGSIGNMISQSFNSPQSGLAHIVVGPQDGNPHSTGGSTETNQNQNNQQRTDSGRPDEDVDMPEVAEDLD